MQISLIAPTFNAAPLVKQFTASILGQVLKPFEVVLIDDGSVDETPLQIEIASNHLRNAGIICTVVKHDYNQGRGAARNSGLVAASGDYVCWLDIDDAYGPDRIDNLARALNGAEIANDSDNWIISSPYVRIKAKDLAKRNEIKPRDIRKLEELFVDDRKPSTLQLQSLSGPRRCFSRIGFDTRLDWAEDFDFIIRFLGLGGIVLADDISVPSDIMYFQSFRSAEQATVTAYNEAVLTKNKEMLMLHNINPKEVLERKHRRYIRHFLPLRQQNSGIEKIDAATGQIDLHEASDKLELKHRKHSIAMSVTSSGFVFEDPSRKAEPATYRVAFQNSESQIVLSENLGITSGPELTTDMVLRAVTRGGVSGEISSDLLRLPRYPFILARSVEGVLLPLPQRSLSGKMSSFTFATIRAENQFETRFSRVSPENEETIFISFFSGPPYYQEAAKRLADELNSRGVDYDICEYVNVANESWLDICRKKIAFYKFQSDRYRRPIMWIDADTQIVGDLSNYRKQQTEFGAFLRNFKYIIGHDPLHFARTFHPGYLYFGVSPRAQDFLAHLLEGSQSAPTNATDDYVLQQGLETFGSKLEVVIFSPDDVVLDSSQDQETAVFRHGDSGNVQVARSSAAQHTREVVSVSRQKAVLSLRAKMMIEKGKLDDAIVYLRDLREIDRNDVGTLASLLRVYSKLGNEGKYKYHFDRYKNDPQFRLPVFRAHLDHLMTNGNFMQARAAAQVLTAEGNKSDRDYVESRLYRHSYDIEATESGLEGKRLNMFWWEQPHPGNLGDIIGPYIVNKLSGAFPHFSTDTPRLLSVGSIIKFAKASDTVWGSGASASDQKINGKATFKAVRGPLTRAMLINYGIECPDIYGDPAWFLPKLFDCSSAKKTHRLGIIRHFIHADSKAEIGDDVRDISIIRGNVKEIESFLLEMNSCEAIISTSLHGLIIANAYGIPACLAVDSSSTRQIHGDGMKFRDYALSVGIDEFVPFDLASVDRVTAKLASVCVHNPRKPIDLVRLAAAAPFEVKLSDRDLQ